MSRGDTQGQSDEKSKTESDLRRFWSKVGVQSSAEGGCWLWLASGGFFSSVAGRLVSPRRYAWARIRGEEVPADTILRATCKVKACVNPGHMKLLWKGKRSDTHCSRGHKIEEANGYWAKDGTWTCRVCKRDHHRVYRKDPEFRARQAAYSRDYARRNRASIEAKKERARRRYAEDPVYRARALENARQRRERLKAEKQESAHG